MRDGDPFVAGRLVQARERAGVPTSALARIVGVSRQTMSSYEEGKTAPKPELVASIAAVLNEDIEFFYAPDLGLAYRHEDVYFRDLVRNRMADRKAAGRELEGVIELAFVLGKYVRYPELRLPKIDETTDPREISHADIESAAERLRECWGLGFEPIRNLVRSAELNGVLLQRFGLDDYEDLDALSIWSEQLGRPVVLLNGQKSSASRSRFDLAHELGHMLLHRNTLPEFRSEPSVHKMLERQAHAFAGALLLPRTTWATEVGEVSLSGLVRMKARWNTSVAAQLFRAKQLGLLSDERFSGLYRQLSSRGWRRKEPLDETMMLEEPVLLRKATEMVAKNSTSGLYVVRSRIPRRSLSLGRHAGVDAAFFEPAMVSLTPVDRDPTFTN